MVKKKNIREFLWKKLSGEFFLRGGSGVASSYKQTGRLI